MVNTNKGFIDGRKIVNFKFLDRGHKYLGHHDIRLLFYPLIIMFVTFKTIALLSIII